jgi:hypothetical protein
MTRELLFVMLFTWFSVSSSAESKKTEPLVESTLTGVVVTEYGKPAVNFRVCTQVHFNGLLLDQIQTCCPVLTNEDGRFTIEHLKPGRYDVFATNEAEGYSIENQSPGQNVTVKAGTSRRSVVIQLRNKGAVVFASITEKATGKIIHDAQLEYSGVDCDAGGDTLKDDGEYHPLPVPPYCDVVLLARANGYKGWVYTDPANPSRPVLKLSAGEHRVLIIQLERLPKDSAEH